VIFKEERTAAKHVSGYVRIAIHSRIAAPPPGIITKDIFVYDSISIALGLRSYIDAGLTAGLIGA